MEKECRNCGSSPVNCMCYPCRYCEDKEKENQELRAEVEKLNDLLTVSETFRDKFREENQELRKNFVKLRAGSGWKEYPDDGIDCEEMEIKGMLAVKTGAIILITHWRPIQTPPTEGK